MRNALVEWPNGGMRFPAGDIRSPVRVRADRAHGAPGGLRGPMVVSADPDVHRAHIQRFARPRLRPHLPAQRRTQPARVDRRVRPRRAAGAGAHEASARAFSVRALDGHPRDRRRATTWRRSSCGCRRRASLAGRRHPRHHLEDRLEGRGPHRARRRPRGRRSPPRPCASSRRRAHPGGVTRIVENRLGLVAGRRRGRLEQHRRTAPCCCCRVDPDASARAHRRGRPRARSASRVGVIITDTARPAVAGRPDGCRHRRRGHPRVSTTCAARRTLAGEPLDGHDAGRRRRDRRRRRPRQGQGQRMPRRPRPRPRPPRRRARPAGRAPPSSAPPSTTCSGWAATRRSLSVARPAMSGAPRARRRTRRGLRRRARRGRPRLAAHAPRR